MVGWNRRVLRLGTVRGDLTRVLEDQRCTVTALECDPQLGTVSATLSTLDADFDVAIVDDILHRLQDPEAVLDEMVRRLVPGGRIVGSVPNAGHVDIRLANTGGAFTLPALRQMLERSGLAIVDLTRVRIPAFETGGRIDRLAVPTETLQALLADPEAETYQFVFMAVRDDGDRQTARLSSRCEALQADVDRQLVSCTSMRMRIDTLQRELDATRTQASGQAEELRGVTEALHRLEADLVTERQHRESSEQELAALRTTKTFRYTHWPRALYRSLFRSRG
jgi:hypothetical protein